MLGKKAGHNERIRTARYKNDGLALTQAGTGRGGAFGVGSCREKIQLVLLEERRKVGTVQQNGNLHPFQPLPQSVDGFLWGQGTVVAQTVFGLGTGPGGGDFCHKRSGAELPPQQRNVIAQQLGECLLRAAQVALAHRRRDRALGHLLRRKRDAAPHAVDEQNGQSVGEQLYQRGAILHRVRLGGDAALGQQIVAQPLPAAQHGGVAVQHVQRHVAELFRRGQPCEHGDSARDTGKHQALGIKIVGTAKHFLQKRKVGIQRAVQRFLRHGSPPLTQDSVAAFAGIYEEVPG